MKESLKCSAFVSGIYTWRCSVHADTSAAVNGGAALRDAVDAASVAVVAVCSQADPRETNRKSVMLPLLVVMVLLLMLPLLFLLLLLLLLLLSRGELTHAGRQPKRVVFGEECKPRQTPQIGIMLM